MKKNKLAIAVVLAVIACAIGALGIVNAEEIGEVQPQGWYAKVTVDLDDSGDGKVVATATNVFTLGTAKVQVIVSLYRADEYTTDTDEMVLMAEGRISDLDMLHSISAFAYTGGKDGYWMAVVKFKKDADPWETGSTACIHFDAQGNKI